MEPPGLFTEPSGASSDRARGAAVRVMTAVTELQNSSVEEWENSVNEVLIMVMIQ